MSSIAPPLAAATEDAQFKYLPILRPAEAELRMAQPYLFYKAKDVLHSPAFGGGDGGRPVQGLPKQVIVLSSSK